MRNFVSIYSPRLLKIREAFRLAYIYWANLIKNGWSVPLPYMLKRSMIASLAKLCNAKKLVETGAYPSLVPWSLEKNFKKYGRLKFASLLQK